MKNPSIIVHNHALETQDQVKKINGAISIEIYQVLFFRVTCLKRESSMHSITYKLVKNLSTPLRPSESEQSLGTRLAADVHDIVVVGEAVEARSRALGVRAHVLEVEPVVDVQDLGEGARRGDHVDAVAGGAPDGVLDHGRGVVAGASDIVQDVVAVLQDAWHGVLVVEDDAREVAVDAIVHVEHVGRGAERGVGHGAARDHMAGQREGRGNEVPAGLADDAHRGREVLVQGSGEDRGHGLERLVACEATADVERVHGEAQGSSLVEDEAGVLHGLDEGLGVGGTGADVEGHADHVQFQLLSKLEELAGAVHGGAELLAEAAQAGRVVGQDAEVQLGVGGDLLGLVQLVGVVEGHLLDASVGSIAQVALGLARLGVDDAGRINTHLQDGLNLVLRGAVEAQSQLGEKAKDLGVGIALDGWLEISVVPM